MFDKVKHRTILVKILKEIYSDPQLRNALGFKGGSAAYLFYNLPRVSVDLDFDLLKPDKKKVVFEKLKEILPQFGKVDDATDKRYTIFFLLNYSKGERNIKIEVSKRYSKSSFQLQSYLGIPVLVMKKEDLLAGKLSALLGRKKFASRDLFDLWFFLKEEWQINEKVLKEKGGFSLKETLDKAIDKVKNIKRTQLLQGLGELLDKEQKQWVRENLKSELLFQLKLYKKNYCFNI